MKNKHCFLDPTPTWIVKECYDELFPLLDIIINKSLSTGIFPSNLKHASVTPIIKDQSIDSNIMSNYRPVSNLPFLAKVIEKGALNQLSLYLEENSLHSNFQSGYRKHHSCETAMLKVVKEIGIHAIKGPGVLGLQGAIFHVSKFFSFFEYSLRLTHQSAS